MYVGLTVYVGILLLLIGQQDRTKSDQTKNTEQTSVEVNDGDADTNVWWLYTDRPVSDQKQDWSIVQMAWCV